MQRTALVVQHDPEIHLGNLHEVLTESGYHARVVDARSFDFTTGTEDIDVVIVLGNDHGVYDKAEHAYIAREEAWLAAWMQRERPTLGVCFGAQIMASALGATVYRGEQTVIGFREVVPTEAGTASPVRHFDRVPVMEWHGDTFTLPEQATLLARSDEYAHEAFAIDNWALAVQFHPETTAEMHEKWLTDAPDAVTAAGYNVEVLRAERERLSDPMQAASKAMLRDWLAGLEKTP